MPEQLLPEGQKLLPPLNALLISRGGTLPSSSRKVAQRFFFPTKEVAHKNRDIWNTLKLSLKQRVRSSNLKSLLNTMNILMVSNQEVLIPL